VAVAVYEPAWAPVTEQVATPPDSVEVVHVGEPGPVRTQVTVPVGVPSEPDTVAVKVKVPPADTVLLITDTEEDALETLAVVSEPEEPE
jgi:hypothetical protein